MLKCIGNFGMKMALSVTRNVTKFREPPILSGLHGRPQGSGPASGGPEGSPGLHLTSSEAPGGAGHSASGPLPATSGDPLEQGDPRLSRQSTRGTRALARLSVRLEQL